MTPEDELSGRIEAAAGSPDRLRAVFAALSAEVGPAEASRLWWAAFGGTDATET